LRTVDGPQSGTADTVRIRYNAARQVMGTVSPDPDGSSGPLKPRAVRNSYDSSGKSGTVINFMTRSAAS
jgi:hypothetical protein